MREDHTIHVAALLISYFLGGIWALFWLRKRTERNRAEGREWWRDK